MDWANEDYVRVYTRETPDDIDLSWEALALWRTLLLRFDRSGLLPVRNGWASVARLIRWPVDVVERAGPELLRDGRVRSVETGLFAPNYVAAQTASKSDKQRQKESRERRRAEADAMQDVEIASARHDVSHAVTRESQPVTPSHSLLCSADPLLRDAMRIQPIQSADQSPPEAAPPQPERAGRRSKPRRSLPDDWQPRPQERERARESRLDCDREAMRFRDHHTAKGTTMVDWDAAFRTWLGNAEQWGRQNGRPANNHSPTQIALDELARLEREEMLGKEQT